MKEHSFSLFRCAQPWPCSTICACVWGWVCFWVRVCLCACAKEAENLSICLRSLRGTMNGLISVQLWSQTGSPVASPLKLPINHRARALRRQTGKDRLKEKRSSLGSIVTAAIMPLLFNTKERGRKGVERIKEIGKKVAQTESGKTCPQISGTSHMGPLAVSLQESSTADRSVNKQCGTSERWARDCVIVLRM